MLPPGITIGILNDSISSRTYSTLSAPSSEYGSLTQRVRFGRVVLRMRRRAVCSPSSVGGGIMSSAMRCSVTRSGRAEIFLHLLRQPTRRTASG